MNSPSQMRSVLHPNSCQPIHAVIKTVGPKVGPNISKRLKVAVEDTSNSKFGQKCKALKAVLKEVQPKTLKRNPFINKNKSRTFLRRRRSACKKFFHTAVADLKDKCLPTALPPVKGPKCTIYQREVNCKVPEQPAWKTPVDKICMPCCCPAYPNSSGCDVRIEASTATRREYRMPAFSECRKAAILLQPKKECCYWEWPCPEQNYGYEPLIGVKQRQEMILGRKKKTSAFVTENPTK